MKVSTKMQIERELREYKMAFKRLWLNLKDFTEDMNQYQMVIAICAPIIGLGWGGICCLLVMGRPIFMACYVVFCICLAATAMLYYNYQEEILEWAEKLIKKI